MLPNVYQSGNSVRLRCIFERSIEGQEEKERFNPDNCRLVIRNHKYEVLETIVLDESNIQELGEWFYHYTTPNEPTLIHYEFVGEYLGSPFLKRKSIETSFV